jgi:hypothetical protein
MDVTKHLNEDSELKSGVVPNSDGSSTPWVSVVLDGEDFTVFGEIDELIEVGRLFLSQALALRDESARELLDAAIAQ